MLPGEWKTQVLDAQSGSQREQLRFLDRQGRRAMPVLIGTREHCRGKPAPNSQRSDAYFAGSRFELFAIRRRIRRTTTDRVQPRTPETRPPISLFLTQP